VVGVGGSRLDVVAMTEKENYYRQMWSAAAVECSRLRLELAALRKQNAAATSATDAEYRPFARECDKFAKQASACHGVAVHDDHGAA
jgi:hypothetical protein